jgi:hypothetical protein
MKHTEVNPRKKVVVGVSTCIDEELKLAQLDLHIRDRILHRMAICRKLHRPGSAGGDIGDDPNIWSHSVLS